MDKQVFVGMPSRARLKDVAEAAGVSVVTVSRAMNAPGTVSAQMRARIEKAMREIDYVPDLTARGMAKRRSGIVAALVPNLSEHTFVDMIRGLESVFADHGSHLLIGSTGYDSAQEEAFVTAVLGRRPDGLILTGTTHTERTRRLAANAGIPVIETWGIEEELIDRGIGYDLRAAGQALTAHLIARDRRRIAYVGRPTDNNQRARAKRDGYLQALGNAGRPIVPELILECETTPNDGRTAVTQLVDELKADAIVFSGDGIATGAFLACLERGIAIPEDVALCGFGDHPMSCLLPGGLTTVRADATQIGTRAAEVILAAHDANGSSVDIGPKRLDIGFEIIVRGST